MKATKRQIAALATGIRPLNVFESACIAQGLPLPVAEYCFALPNRKWRFDWAWPTQLIALEIEGGVWTKGRHTRGGGFLKDVKKYNAAACLGWRVLRCMPKEFNRGDVFGVIKLAMEVKL